MITNAILQLAYFVISGVINLLPTSTGFPSDVHTAMSGLGGYMAIWNPLVPVATMLTCLGIVFSVEIAVFGFKTVKWLISHIPFIGGKG